MMAADKSQSLAETKTSLRAKTCVTHMKMYTSKRKLGSIHSGEKKARNKNKCRKSNILMFSNPKEKKCEYEMQKA